MDPLSEVLALMKPESYVSGGYEVAPGTAVQFPKRAGVKCYAVMSGQCWLSVRDILRVNEGWREADISQTQVVAEGPCDEGVSIHLEAPEPENPKASRRESVGELWIQTDEGCTVNVQLSQFEGRLKELYLLFIDPKHPKRKLPETWTEVSREATDI